MKGKRDDREVAHCRAHRTDSMQPYRILSACAVVAWALSCHGSHRIPVQDMGDWVVVGQENLDDVERRPSPLMSVPLH